MKSKSTVSRTKTTSKKTKPRAEEAAPANDTTKPKREQRTNLITLTHDELEAIKRKAVNEESERWSGTPRGRVQFARDRIDQATGSILNLWNFAEMCMLAMEERARERGSENQELREHRDSARKWALSALWDLHIEVECELEDLAKLPPAGTKA